MKKLIALSQLLFTSLVMAHPGHGMADNNWHYVFHVLFWLLAVVVAVKGYRWWQAKNKSAE
ncbi:hypothetical protein [Paraglaciecola hydrolytica]|uniref:Uncharacterized protein n=1 Tax=Paraglaciecola hydrolytica TaxID=1799789 RepID=A0A136A4Z9_9ALTE|nr:hypothetical protein [Paraglaciecola hydrolytica]KXI30200.1 hypothetical protein AX660_09440 [Paraglaciecola hydrolytica]